MSHYNDIALGATIDVPFDTTVQGVGTTLAGSPVISAYVDNGTTEITAGITLTVDLDGRTGMNNARVVATSGNGFAAGTRIRLAITVGTVGGYPAVGRTVGSFSIQASSMEARVPATLISGRMDVSVGAVAAGVIAAASFAAGAFDAVWTVATRALSAAGVQAIWDALTSALTTVGSIGKMLVDKLNGVSGQVAGQSEVTGIQNNTRTVLVVPELIERPDAGTDTYLVHLYLYDEVGNMEAPDAAPTLAIANAAGTDRTARLGGPTGTLVGTGHYKWTYTNTVTDALEQLLWDFSVVEGGATRLFGRQTLIVDTTAVDFTATDRTNLTTALGVLQSGAHGNAALKTLVDDVPTNAELTAALGTADDATLAAIAAVPAAVKAAAAADPFAANVKEVANVPIDGVGTLADPWGPA